MPNASCHQTKTNMADVNEKLSEAVRRFPVLYDKTCKDFKDQLKKNNAWEDVAKEIGADSATDAKSRFVNLRNRYSREKRKIKQAKTSGSGYDEVEESKEEVDDMFTYLSWLDGYYKPRKTLTNLQPIEINPNEGEEAEQPDTEARYCDNAGSSSTTVSQSNAPSMKKCTKLAPRKKSDQDIATAELEMLKTIRERLSKPSPNVQPSKPKSEDQLFCDLLASQLERIPYERKLGLRMQISNMVCQELMASMSPASPEQASTPFFPQPYPRQSHFNMS